MSASGKSSNRRSEYNRGYYGGGHGIYAAQGRRDAERQRGNNDPKPVKPEGDDPRAGTETRSLLSTRAFVYRAGYPSRPFKRFGNGWIRLGPFVIGNVDAWDRSDYP